MSLFVDQKVQCRVKAGNSDRKFFLSDAHIETISECGRYVKVSGRRSWHRKKEVFYIYARDIMQ